MYNTYTKVLTGLTDMLVVVRSNHSLVMVQGRLVVIGGYKDKDYQQGGGAGHVLEYL